MEIDMDVEELDHRIEEIEHELLRDDPTLKERFVTLDPVVRRHDATVSTLLVASTVFLMIGLATTSLVAWLVGAVSFVAAFSVDTRHERRLRALRRSSERAHRRRPPRHRQLGATP
ncbi:MAG: DUF3040 domain-containing protein [Acidimicrobiia bacterium]